MRPSIGSALAPRGGTPVDRVIRVIEGCGETHAVIPTGPRPAG